MISVEPEHLAVIRQILHEYVPDCEVRVFGSRVEGRARPYSDLDLAIIAEKKITRRTRMLLRKAFEESRIPYRVDIIDYNAASKEFQEVVNQRYEVI